MVPLAEPVAFHSVSEHQDGEAHRPVRRRHHHGEASAAPTPLQLVETTGQAEAAPVEEDLPHRTKPRRRRGGATDAEPLMMVETTGKEDSPPAQ